MADLESVNPATEERVATYERHDDDEVSRRISRAWDAFGVQKATTFEGRAEKMNRMADLLEEQSAELGALMTREMGKPVTQAKAEAEKCAWVCRYYADHAEDFMADEMAETDAKRSFVSYEPIGPVLAVMPWNFPFWQVYRFAAPALMAGNVGLLKHASNVTGCALKIEELFAEAGFDRGEFQALLISSDKVGDVIADDRIRGTTLTGSEGAGRAVGRQSGEAIKPNVLELGGSDPFIVLADADLEKAVEVGITSRMQNNSQSCIAAKRFIVEEAVLDDFTERFVAGIEALKVGDPMDEDTDVGPMARGDLRDEVHDQVERAIDDGAELQTGGEKLSDRDGFFYAPTVLTNVKAGSVAFDEEIFGPVASITPARDVDHAVELANQSKFGLGGAVFTEDRAKGEDVARRLEVGCAFVNEMVKSDPRLPFGGVKASGYGRELGRFGLREFCNIKTIWVE